MSKKDWFSIKNTAGSTSAEVYIYDEIGYWGTTAKAFITQLKELSGKHINLRINSPGGNVFDGIAIYNVLKNHRGGVTAYIDGLAASIASVIPLAAEKIVIGTGSMMMIHNPFCLAIGNAKELRETADTLDKIAHSIATTYMQKTGKTVKEIAAAMESETWFEASEAIEFGLADELEEGLSVAASISKETLDHLGYSAPENIISDKTPTIGAVKDLSDEGELGSPSAGDLGSPRAAQILVLDSGIYLRRD